MKIAILGIGNLLLKDEGFGVHFIKRIDKKKLPPNVDVIEGAVLGLQIFNFLLDYDKVIVVDAVKGGGEPGKVYKFKIEECRKDFGMISLHDLDFIKSLEIIKQFYNVPEMVVIGVEPKSTEVGMELTPEVEKSINKVMELVFEEINNSINQQSHTAGCKQD